MAALGLVLVCVHASPVTGQVRRVVQLDEYRVKAAHVYRFPQFVTWPPAALATSTDLTVCVMHPSPFGDELPQLIQGESVNGRPLRLREIGSPTEVPGCHALFVGAHVAARSVLRAIDDLPILTIGEAEGFLDDGGVIQLRVVAKRVRFEVDAANARKAGLRIDAQLLNLAVAVRGGKS